MFWRKMLALATALVVGGSLAAGCGQGGQKPSGQTAPQPAQQSGAPQVTLKFWTIALKPTFNDYINGLIEKYQKANPNVKVEWTDLPFNSIQDKLLTAIAAGDAPDVVNLNTEMAVNLAVRGALLDIDKVATPEQKSIYFEKLWRSAEYKGGVYAFPWYASGQVLIYNKAIFEKAGLDPNKPPKNSQELVAYARQIKERTGIYGFMPENRGNQFFFAAGIPIVSPDKTKAAFNTPRAVEKLRWYGNLFRERLVPEDAVTKDYQTALQRYMGGQLAMVLTGPQFLKRIKENAPEIFKTTWVAPWPRDEGDQNLIPLMNLVVPKLSKHHKEAVDFAAFVTNDENQLAFAKIVSILPSTKKAAADDFFKTKDTTNVEAVGTQIAVEQLATGADLALGIGAKQNEIGKLLTDAMQQVALGKKTPEEALKEAEQKANEILARD